MRARAPALPILARPIATLGAACSKRMAVAGGIASSGNSADKPETFASAQSEPGDWPGRDRRDANTEAYDKLDENPFRNVSADPLSTFSIDVDTASYANMRRFLNDGPAAAGGCRADRGDGQLFPLTTIRSPTGDAPFSVTIEVAECPWKPTASAGAHRPAGQARSPTKSGRRATWCS